MNEPLLLISLDKARRGEERPGHKYIRRKRGRKGEWLYTYPPKEQTERQIAGRAPGESKLTAWRKQKTPYPRYQAGDAEYAVVWISWPTGRWYVIDRIDERIVGDERGYTELDQAKAAAEELELEVQRELARREKARSPVIKKTTAKPGTTESEKPKNEPWEMTSDEFVDSMAGTGDLPPEKIKLRHRRKVLLAVRLGRRVPDEVLAEYPEIAEEVQYEGQRRKKEERRYDINPRWGGMKGPWTIVETRNWKEVPGLKFHSRTEAMREADRLSEEYGESGVPGGNRKSLRQPALVVLEKARVKGHKRRARGPWGERWVWVEPYQATRHRKLEYPGPPGSHHTIPKTVRTARSAEPKKEIVEVEAVADTVDRYPGESPDEGMRRYAESHWAKPRGVIQSPDNLFRYRIDGCKFEFTIRPSTTGVGGPTWDIIEIKKIIRIGAGATSERIMRVGHGQQKQGGGVPIMAALASVLQKARVKAHRRRTKKGQRRLALEKG